MEDAEAAISQYPGPRLPKALYRKARALLGLQRPGDAIVALERAAELTPHDRKVQAQLSKALLRCVDTGLRAWCTWCTGCLCPHRQKDLLKACSDPLTGSPRAAAPKRGQPWLSEFRRAWRLLRLAYPTWNLRRRPINIHATRRVIRVGLSQLQMRAGPVAEDRETVDQVGVFATRMLRERARARPHI